MHKEIIWPMGKDKLMIQEGNLACHCDKSNGHILATYMDGKKVVAVVEHRRFSDSWRSLNKYFEERKDI
jgi:hypothetical protein